MIVEIVVSAKYGELMQPIRKEHQQELLKEHSRIKVRKKEEIISTTTATEKVPDRYFEQAVQTIR